MPYVWYVIFLLSIVNVFNYMDRMALAVLAPSIKADLHLSDTRLGLLTGLAFALFYAICGIPLARWADRGVRRDVIAISVATWSIVTALGGAAQNFWQLFMARVGVGAGEAGGLAPAQSLICDYVPLKRRSGALSIHMFGLYAGMMLGMALAGRLSEIVGWRWTFVALGLPGIVLAWLVRFTLREPTRGYFDAVKVDKTGMSFAATITTLWRCETYRWLTLWAVSLGFVQCALTQWWPSYYVRVYGLSLTSVGVYLGMALGVGSGIGILLGGFLANKAAERDVTLPLVIGAGATVLALPTAVGSLLVTSAFGSIFLVSLTALFWGVSNGPVAAAFYSVVSAQMRSMAGAINVFFTSALGFGLGPFSVGMLSDVLAPSLGPQALRVALLAANSVLPVVVIVLFAAAKTLRNDLRAAGAYVEAN